LWNEPQRLDPKKFARYSEKNIDPETSFKKSICDLEKIERNEKEKLFKNSLSKLTRVRQDDADKYMQRKLERLIW
jgi:hypothetical protein